MEKSSICVFKEVTEVWATHTQHTFVPSGELVAAGFGHGFQLDDGYIYIGNVFKPYFKDKPTLIVNFPFLARARLEESNDWVRFVPVRGGSKKQKQKTTKQKRSLVL